jgi:hypothetical protein
MFCQKNFCIVAEVMLNNGFASTHLEKYSTTTAWGSCLALLVAGRRCLFPTERRSTLGVLAVSRWRRTCCMGRGAGILGNGARCRVHQLLPKASRTPGGKPSAPELSCQCGASICRCVARGVVA